MQTAAVIALNHHERFDGTGLSRQSSRSPHPIEGRIVATADVFDALTSERPHRSTLRLEEAAAPMKGARGTHFEPGVLDALLDALEDLSLIRARA